MAKNSIAKYVRFTEINEEENEQWNFYLPVKGNEKAIMELAEAIMESDEYWLDDKMIEEWHVDELVDGKSGTEYYPEHQKLSGLLPIETFVPEEYKDLKGNKLKQAISNDVNNALYKGGIIDLMQD